MPPAASILHRETRPLYAIFLRLLAMAAITTTFALVKLLGERGVNIIELIFYRQFLAIPIVYAWIVTTRGPMGFTTRRIDRHATRTALGIIGMLLNFGAVSLLPLAESTTIGFTAPIFATILSALFLGEKTGIHRWSAVILGFIGVIIMARPDSSHFPPLGLAVAMAAAVSVAIISIVLRELSRTEPAPVIVFWFSVLSVPPAGAAMFWFGQVHSLETFLLLGLLGLAGGISQMLMTSALRWGPVSIVLPMDYSSILWATLLGWLLWNTLPAGSTWVGAALIIASGLYIAWREHRLGQIAKLNAQADADMRA